MTFRVGQKVVCVDAAFDDSWMGRAGIKSLPAKGGVYTVRSVTAYRFRGETDPLPALLLQEISNPVFDWDAGMREIAFWTARFRPIVERKTDITVFTEILRKATKPARTPAMSLHHLGTET